MNAARPNTMEILRPADVGAHCVRPREAKRLPYEFYWMVFCILQQPLLITAVLPSERPEPLR